MFTKDKAILKSFLLKSSPDFFSQSYVQNDILCLMVISLFQILVVKSCHYFYLFHLVRRPKLLYLYGPDPPLAIFFEKKINIFGSFFF